MTGLWSAPFEAGSARRRSWPGLRRRRGCDVAAGFESGKGLVLERGRLGWR